MPGVIGRRAVRRGRNRRMNSPVNRPAAAAPVLITSSNPDGGTSCVLTFNQPVMLTGVPGYTVDQPGVTVVGAEQTASNEVTLTFSGPTPDASHLNIGFRDPAIRGVSGGYVSDPLYWF